MAPAANEESAKRPTLHDGMLRRAAIVFVAVAVGDQEAEVTAAVRRVVVRQVGRGVALTPAFEFRVVAILIEDAETALGPVALHEALVCQEAIVAAEDTQRAEQSQPMPLPMMLPSNVLWPLSSKQNPNA